MDDRIDAIAKRLGQSAGRREVVQGLGALALGSLGVLGVSRAAGAESCKERCKEHCLNQIAPRKKPRLCRKRCQKQCD
jgi:hypothetical protein